MFYQGFVEVFFDRGRERRNEIQTEVLAAFAGQFPTRFLEEFLAGKSSSTNIAIRSVSPTLFTVELSLLANRIVRQTFKSRRVIAQAVFCAQIT
jgi:hypothetical protein